MVVDFNSDHFGYMCLHDANYYKVMNATMMRINGVGLFYRSRHEKTREQSHHGVTEAGQDRCNLDIRSQRNQQHSKVSEVQHGAKHYVHIPNHLVDCPVETYGWVCDNDKYNCLKEHIRNLNSHLKCKTKLQKDLVSFFFFVLILVIHVL